MISFAEFVDRLINQYYDTHNNTYPSKIIAGEASYSKLMEVCKEQDLSCSWFDFPFKNYKGIPIEISEETEIKLE